MWASAAAWLLAGLMGLCATTYGRTCGQCALANGTCYFVAYALSVALSVIACLGLMPAASDGQPPVAFLRLPVNSAGAAYFLMAILVALQTCCLILVCGWCCAGVTVTCGPGKAQAGWGSDEMGWPDDDIPPRPSGVFDYTGGTIKSHRPLGSTMQRTGDISAQGTGGITGQWHSMLSAASTLYGTATMSSAGGMDTEEGEQGWSLHVRIPVAWPAAWRMARVGPEPTGGLIITRNGVVTHEDAESGKPSHAAGGSAQ